MTSPRQVMTILQQVSLFADLDAAALRSIADSANRRRVQPGEDVVEWGSNDTDLFVVVSGHFKVWIPTTDGKGISLNMLGPGDIFGELSLLDGRPRSASVSCITKGELLIVHRAELLHLLRRSPDMAVKLLQRLAGLVRSLSTRAEERATHQLRERLAGCLLDLSERCGVALGGDQVALGIRLPQRELGELVQGTRESVNKWINRWTREGIVCTVQGQIVIRDRARLRAEAQRS